MGSILEYKYETDTENFYDCKFWSLVFVKDDLSELFLLCVLMLFLYIGVIFLLKKFFALEFRNLYNVSISCIIYLSHIV
jgi:hypothetical protein